MKIINISHVSFPDERDPQAWIAKSSFFKGIWEAVALRHQVIFIDFINYEGTVTKGGLEYRFLKRSKKALRFPWSVHRMIAQEAPDIVLVHGMQFPLQTLLLGWLLPKSCRLVVQDHGGIPLRHPLKKWLQRLADRYTDAYFFTAKEQAAVYERIIKEKRKVKEIIEVSSVFNPGNRAEARAITGVVGKYTYIWVGHLQSHKDPMLAISAFCRFAEHVPEAHLYMVFQTGELLPQIQAYLAAHPVVAGNVHLVGAIAHFALEPWFNGVDFVLSTSRREAGGVSVTEGMSCGCIPVLSNIPSFLTMTKGQCGVIYEGGNEQALLEALLRSVTMDFTVERTRTLKYYQEHLSFEAIARQIEETLEAL